jgi:hypothetical protein
MIPRAAMRAHFAGGTTSARAEEQTRARLEVPPAHARPDAARHVRAIGEPR